MGQRGNRGGHDVAAPAVLDGHRHPQRGAEIPGPAGLGQAPKLANLQVHHVHGPVRRRPQQRRNAVDHLVQDERMVRGTPHGQTLLVVGTGLFNVDIHVPHRAHHAACLVHQPARVGVGYQDFVL